MRTVFVAEPGAAVRACADRRYTRSGRAMRSISCREDAAVLRAVRVPACAFVRRRELRAIRHAAVGGGSSRAIRATEGVVCLFPSGGEKHCPRLSVSAFLFVRGSPDRTRNTLLAISKNSPGTGKFGSEELHIAEFSLHLHSRFPYFRHTVCPDGGIGRRVGLKHQ